MQLNFALQQAQSQKLLMTTQMRQAIELLQCSSGELADYLKTEVADNPVVELDIPEAIRASWQGPQRQQSGRVAATGLQTVSWEALLPAELSMYESLTSQLRCMRLAPRTLQVACYLAGCLDESGYLAVPLSEVAVEMQVSEEEVERALYVLQQCDPLGIGARTLEECLRLQLVRVPAGQRSLVERVIREHLPDVAGGRLAAIAKSCRVPVSEVQEAVNWLRRLQPRPGLTYAAARPVVVRPDVVVSVMSGELMVHPYEGAHPQLRIRPEYQQWLAASDAETRSYIIKKLQKAEWLVRCLEQRRLTVQRVASAIVEVQRSFMLHGISELRPLTLRQIAEQVGVHESTVSRAVRGKYMATPQGLYEMKFFFTAHLASTTGGTSARAAKHAIQQCIDRENKFHPMSDEAIAQQLQEQGIHISRRTVAKYREQLKIAPSWQRRQYAEG